SLEILPDTPAEEVLLEPLGEEEDIPTVSPVPQVLPAGTFRQNGPGSPGAVPGYPTLPGPRYGEQPRPFPPAGPRAPRPRSSPPAGDGKLFLWVGIAVVGVMGLGFLAFVLFLFFAPQSGPQVSDANQNNPLAKPLIPPGAPGKPEFQNPGNPK